MDNSENTQLEPLQHHIDKVLELQKDLLEQGLNEKIHSASLCEISEAFLYFESSNQNFASISKYLGIPSASVTKIMNLRGEFKVQDAIIVSSKVISKLKSLEGTFNREQEKLNLNSIAGLQPENIESKPSKTEAIKAIAWAVNPNNKAIKIKIVLISELLEQIITQSTQSNLPESEQALTAIEKAQLIAILETVLSILKSPLIEKGIFLKLLDSLKNISKKTIENKTQEALGKTADETCSLLKGILNEVDWDNFTF